MKIDSYLRQIGSFQAVWKTLKTIPLSKLQLKALAVACGALAFVAFIYKTSRKPSNPGSASPVLPIRPREVRVQEPVSRKEQLKRRSEKNVIRNQQDELQGLKTQSQKFELDEPRDEYKSSQKHSKQMGAEDENNRAKSNELNVFDKQSQNNSHQEDSLNSQLSLSNHSSNGSPSRTSSPITVELVIMPNTSDLPKSQNQKGELPNSEIDQEALSTMQENAAKSKSNSLSGSEPQVLSLNGSNDSIESVSQSETHENTENLLDNNLLNTSSFRSKSSSSSRSSSPPPSGQNFGRSSSDASLPNSQASAPDTEQENQSNSVSDLSNSNLNTSSKRTSINKVDETEQDVKTKLDGSDNKESLKLPLSNHSSNGSPSRQASPKSDLDLIESLDNQSNDTLFDCLQDTVFPSDKGHASEDEIVQKPLNNTPLLNKETEFDEPFEELYLGYLPKEEEHFVIEGVFDRAINEQSVAQDNAAFNSPVPKRNDQVEGFFRAFETNPNTSDQSQEDSQQIDSPDEQSRQLGVSKSNSLSGSEPQVLSLNGSNASIESVSQSETHENTENLFDNNLLNTSSFRSKSSSSSRSSSRTLEEQILREGSSPDQEQVSANQNSELTDVLPGDVSQTKEPASMPDSQPQARSLSNESTQIGENHDAKKRVRSSLEDNEDEETPELQNLEPPNKEPIANRDQGLLSWLTSPFQWMGVQFSACAKTLVDALENANDAVQKAVEYRQLFKEGIDLIPLLMQVKIKKDEIAKATTEWWNSPSAPYDPFTANLMMGFADEFGKCLHCLLMNSFRLGGPRVTSILAQQLNITGFAAEQVKNKLLALSNPLGMLHLLFTIGRDIIKACNVLSSGLIVNLDVWIEEMVREKALGSLDPDVYDYLYATAAVLAKQRAYEKCLSEFLEKLGEQGIEEPTGGWATLRATWAARPWYVEHEDAYADESYKAAKQAYLDECEKHQLILDKKLIPNALEAAAFVGFYDIELFLKNTVRKTLNHFLEVLYVQIEASAYSEDTKQGLKEIAHDLVFGENISGEERENQLLLAKAANVAAYVTTTLNTALKKPLAFIPFEVPSVMKEKAYALSAPVNEIVGNIAGNVIAGAIDEKLILSLGLQNLSGAFKGQQLRFNLEQVVSGLNLHPEMQEKLQGIIEYISLDEYLEPIVQQIGRKMARRVAVILSDNASQQMRLDATKYPREQLISRVYDRNLLQKVSYVASLVVGPTVRFSIGLLRGYGLGVIVELEKNKTVANRIKMNPIIGRLGLTNALLLQRE